MAGGKRPAPFRTRKLSRLCADGTATGGSWESKTLPQSTVSWGWGTGLETGQYPTPPFYAHTLPGRTSARIAGTARASRARCICRIGFQHRRSLPPRTGGGSHRRADVFDCQVMTYLRRVTKTVPIKIAARPAITRPESEPVVARREGRSKTTPRPRPSSSPVV